MTPRSYDAPKRREAAQATRLKILEAARSLIGGKGDLGAFSVDAVARKAGVSRMTVYYQFESRAELLEALADDLAHRGGMERMREVFSAPSLEEGLRELVETFTGFWATDRVTLRRLRAMGVVFPADSSAAMERDRWRRQAVAALLERHGLPGRGKGGKGGSLEDLVDALTTLTSFETFDHLCSGTRKAEATTALISRMALEVLRGFRQGG